MIHTITNRTLRKKVAQLQAENERKAARIAFLEIQMDKMHDRYTNHLAQSAAAMERFMADPISEGERDADSTISPVDAAAGLGQ